MIHQNFYLDFLIDLKADRAEFDSSCAAKILGDNISRFVGGTDLLLRFTHTEDRVDLLDAIGNCLDTGAPIHKFYRWEASKGFVKALEVRAEFVHPHQLVGVIIDQQGNTHRLFPLLSLTHLAQARNESYLLINRHGRIIDSTHLDLSSDQQLQIVFNAKKFLSGQPLEGEHAGVRYFKIPQNSPLFAEDLALCVCNSQHSDILIRELESLLNRFRSE